MVIWEMMELIDCKIKLLSHVYLSQNYYYGMKIEGSFVGKFPLVKRI